MMLVIEIVGIALSVFWLPVLALIVYVLDKFREPGESHIRRWS
jgi:hypothetical protein